MMVELSADDLQDLPSFRENLEDTDVKKLARPEEVEETAAPAVLPPIPEPEPDRDAETGPVEMADTPPGGEAATTDAETGPIDSIDARLEAAVEKMQGAEMREDIADAMLSFCAPYLKRCLLLAVRKDVVMGWRGQGEGIDQLWVRSMSIPLDEPSVFVSLTLGKELWRGSLPSMPGNEELLLGLGGEVPAQCVILPVFVRSKPVAFLYGDNIDEGLAQVPIDALRRLVAKASLAFQVYMLRNKMRTV
jgi:hypothetical protein